MPRVNLPAIKAIIAFAILSTIANGRGCNDKNWDGFNLGGPFFASIKYGHQIFIDSLAPDFRASPNIEVGITGMKLSLGAYLALSNIYCAEVQSEKFGRYYTGANMKSYFRNISYGVEPGLLYLWGFSKYRRTILLGAEVSVVSLRNYIEFMHPGRIYFGMYLPVLNRELVGSNMFSGGIGFSW